MSAVRFCPRPPFFNNLQRFYLPKSRSTVVAHSGSRKTRCAVTLAATTRIRGAGVEKSINLLPSKLTLYRRSHSARWQCRYRINGTRWYRESTGEHDLDDAKERAFKLYYSAEERTRNNLPANTRRFRQVAEHAGSTPFFTTLVACLSKESINDVQKVAIPQTKVVPQKAAALKDTDDTERPREKRNTAAVKPQAPLTPQQQREQ